MHNVSMIEDRFAEIQQAEAFLDRLFGTRTGYVSMSFGHNPRLKSEPGRRFAPGDMRPRHYAWPAERDEIIGDVDDLLNSPATKHENVEVFINPALRKKPSRKAGTHAPLKWIWCDVDHTPTQDQIARMNALGAMTVLSGTNGNRHIYIELDKPVDVVNHRALERLLSDCFDGDSKITENDLLRLPGTWNWKNTEPSQVFTKSVGRTSNRRVTNRSLIRTMLSMTNFKKKWVEYRSQAKEEMAAWLETEKPVEDRLMMKIKAMPELVRKAYQFKPPAGRQSDAIFNLVAACKEARLDRADTHAILKNYEPAIRKWTSAHRIAADVDRIWSKVRITRDIKQDQSEAGEDDGTIQPTLRFHKLSDLAFRVDRAPKPQFLFKDIIVQGDYGILSAQDKAGKSFAMADAAVSAASGTPWMNKFDTITQGPVLLCIGEGSERKQIRRIRAIGEHKGLTQDQTDQLPIYVLLGVPQVRDEDDLRDLEEMVRRTKPVLLIIDPFYLAASGIDFSKLSDVGQALQNIQTICQRYNCSLILSHHWNKTGNGDPHSRTSGVGLTAWGRFLISISLPDGGVKVDPETGRTTVPQTWYVKGDEIITEDFTVERTIWVDDQSDLTSAMHYQLRIPDQKAADQEKPMRFIPVTEKVSTILSDNMDGLTSRQINAEHKTQFGKLINSNTLQIVLDQLVLHNFAQAGTARQGKLKPYYHLKSFERPATTPNSNGRRELVAATSIKEVDFSKARRGKADRTMRHDDV